MIQWSGSEQNWGKVKARKRKVVAEEDKRELAKSLSTATTLRSSGLTMAQTFGPIGHEYYWYNPIGAQS